MEITSRYKELPYCNYLVIYINKIIHIKINTEEFIALRSWKIKPELDPDPYFIEILFKNNKFLLQYDTQEKWEGILQILDTVNI